MPQALMALRAGARAAAIIARRCAASVTRSSAGSGRWSSGGCPVAVVAATLSMRIRGTGRESIRARTSRQHCGTALVLGVPATIAAVEEAVDRRCRRIPRRESLAASTSIPLYEKCLISRHHGRQNRLPLAGASSSPYHEGVRFLRYKLRSTLARHEKRTSAKGRQPIRPLAAVFNVCPSRNAIRRSSENITNAYAYKGR